MGKLIAVSGMFLNIVEGNPTVVLGTIVIVGTPTTIVKGSGNNVYLDQLAIQVTGITSPVAGATIPDPGPVNGSINASVQYVKSEGTLVLVEGDQTNILSATPKIPATPTPIDYPVTFKIEITNAGQIYAKAE